MIPRASLLIVAFALLTACGGGGGKSGSLPPTSTPATKKIGTATFTLKIPSSSTMTKLRRRYYQSQATQGVAIDWTSSNPYAPDYSAPISATCPVPTGYPPGVTSCGPDPVDGGTDYTFQLQIPAGSYPNFTVTTFDAAPASGAFPAAPAANMLAQGQLAAPVVITGGASNTIPNLTFYGIPASVSFQPGPAQAHVTTYNGTIAIIGNAPQTFFAQALDADGFAIDSTDGTAPTVSVVEIPDLCNCLTTAGGSAANSYILQAKSAGGDLAQINATATPGGGLQAVTSSYPMTVVQEIWSAQSGGIYGYPLYPSPGPSAVPVNVTGSAIDYAASGSACSGACTLGYMAMDPHNNIWALATNGGGEGFVLEYTQSAGAPALVAPSSYTGIALPPSPTSVAIDTNGYMYVPDAATGDVYLYNTNSPSAPLTEVPFVMSSSDPQTVTVAPATAPNGAAGTIWVGGSSEGSAAIEVYSGGSLTPIVTMTPPPTAAAPQALTFDPSGNLWVYDGVNYYEFTVGSGLSLSGPVVTQVEAGITYAGSNQMVASVQGGQSVAFIGSNTAPSPVGGFGISYVYAGGTGPSSQNIGTTWGILIAP
jgi:hypothetical protein